jgi:hypothetical protein
MTTQEFFAQLSPAKFQGMYRMSSPVFFSLVENIQPFITVNNDMALRATGSIIPALVAAEHHSSNTGRRTLS